MSDSPVNQQPPAVAVRLELAVALQPADAPGAALSLALSEAVQRSLAELLVTLGIIGQPEVRISWLAQGTLPNERFLRVYVNEQLCRYSDELLEGVHSYVTGRLLDVEATPARLFAWLQESMANGSADVVEYLAQACLEIIKQQPAVLFGRRQAEALAAALQKFTDPSGPKPAVWPPDPADLREILSPVLKLKISLADRPALSRAIEDGLSSGRALESISEDVIEALCPEDLELRLPPDLLRQITTDWQAAGPDMFSQMRDGLFNELGLTYPACRFVDCDDLKPNSFAFKINHVTSLPMVSLGVAQCLVNDTVEHLRELKLAGLPAANPASGQPGSVVDRTDQAAAELPGLTTWNQMGYFILCLADALRKNSACFVNRKQIHRARQDLESAFPALVKAAAARQISEDQIASLARGLLAEGISIRNGRLILELALDYDPAKHPGGPLAFIRAGMQRQIGAKYMRGTSTLVVYLVEAQIEQLACQHSEHNLSATTLEEGDDAIIRAIKTEIEYLRRMAPTAVTPSMLTVPEARQPLHDIIASEFQRIAVLSYPEVPPNTNVQPVARISLKPSA